ncbi:MAG: hypothetical protein SFU98_04230 [Leptospiraceae bacterium]|nr:hypothetical protein [Leptospiraceae bacterium]
MNKFILLIFMITFQSCFLITGSSSNGTSTSTDKSVSFGWYVTSGPHIYNRGSSGSSGQSSCIESYKEIESSSCSNAEVITPNTCHSGSIKRGTMKFYKINFTESNTITTFVTPTDKSSVKNCQFIYKPNIVATTSSYVSDLEDNQVSGTSCLSSSTATVTSGSFRCFSIQSFCDSSYFYKTHTGQTYSFTKGTITGTPSLPTRSVSTTTYSQITGITAPIFGYLSSAVIPIGFNFTFAGVTYTHIYLSSQGMIAFDTSSLEYSHEKISSVRDQVIAPWWSKLDMDCNSSVSYLLESNDQTPKTLTIQWKEMIYHDDKNSSSRKVSFQLKLKQTANTIEFIYGPMTSTTSDKKTATTGIRYYMGGVGGYIDGISGSNSMITYDISSFPIEGTIIRFTP